MSLATNIQLGLGGMLESNAGCETIELPYNILAWIIFGRGEIGFVPVT